MTVSQSTDDGISFEPSSEIRLIRSQIDEFIEKEIEPLEQEHDQFLGEEKEWTIVDEDGRLVDEYLALRQQIREKSVEAGFYTMHMPERVGGGGLSALEYTMVLEHIHNRHPDGFHTMMLDGLSVTPSIIPMYEDDYQRENYFEPIMNAEKHMAFGLSEPDHGSDPHYMDTTAEKDGDEWVIDGTKCHVSNSPNADFMLLFARTSGSDGDVTGISAFVVDRGNPGWELGKIQRPMGTELGNHAFNHFNGCRVPESQMIGEEGRGFLTAMDWVGGGRLSVPARAVGSSEWMFEQCVDYADGRTTFGEPIAERQFVQDHLATMRTRIEEVRWLYRYCAWKMDRDEEHRWLQSAAKWRGSELWCDVADAAIQLHGGAGYWRSLPFESVYRDARATRIYEGTDEIQKRTIAKQFLDI